MKSRAKSKTYWLGMISIILGTVVSNPEIIGPYFGDHAGLIMMILGIAGMVIREYTSESLSTK